MGQLVKRLLGAILVTALVATSAACDRESEGALKVLVIGDDRAQVRDPAQSKLGAADSILLANSAQGLVRFDQHGQIEPGLAETWNVSDDGLSYIFRLANTEWPDGRKVTAERVARLLRKQIASQSDNPLKDSLGAIDKVVAMTDRVLEIRLSSARPHLLQLLAQPELALVQDGEGTGPFSIQRNEQKRQSDQIRLSRETPIADEEETQSEELVLAGAPAADAVEAFVAGRADLVLGGTFIDLPYARQAQLPRRALRFDPALGFFGLVPGRSTELLDNPEFRRLLSQAVDRAALITALGVPGLLPRATILEPALDNIPDPQQPQWLEMPIAERRQALAPIARELIGEDELTLTIAVPEGPGSEIILQQLSQDWGALGIKVEAAQGKTADLVLIDRVAPANSPGWYLRQFRCGVAKICDEEVDTVLEQARAAVTVAERSALLLDASRRIDSLSLAIPLTAPVRWSLVSSRITGFAENRFARHPLTGLTQPLSRTAD